MMKLSIQLLLLCGLICGTAFAEDNSPIVTVKVMVNAAPCEINNNQLINVDFGDNIITTDVAGGTVEKSVNYTLDCTNADQSKTLVMRISGSGADFDNALLETSIQELGVKFEADGADYPLNTSLVLGSFESKPAIMVILVQQPGVRLPTGGFTAGATMTVDYQ